MIHIGHQTKLWVIKKVFYAGIGSRQTPPEILSLMTKIAIRLREGYNFILRSGGAIGADTAFEEGAGTQTEIFLSNNRVQEAREIAKNHHPAWNNLSEYVQGLMTRNAQIILGEYINKPVEFVVCWTKDGAETLEQTTIYTGGTGHAIRIASTYKIPVFNLYHKDCLMRIRTFLQKNGYLL